MNSGIIATIFSTCVVFTALVFRVKYQQVLTAMDWLGCLIIMGCVVLIGVGASQGDGSDDEDKIDTRNLVYAVLSALISGLVFTINTVNVNYVIRDL